jgi:hypothetical protein
MPQKSASTVPVGQLGVMIWVLIFGRHKSLFSEPQKRAQANSD